MNTEQFINAYNESRNGANYFLRHGLVRKFQFSDGVRQCAEAGCYWLLDIFATESAMVLRKKQENFGVLTVKVKESKATMTMTGSGDVRLWRKVIDYTDMPEGNWVFYLSDEGERFALILPKEY
jgi:hypothetical protein